MNTTSKIKTGIITFMLSLISSYTQAQGHRHARHGLRVRTMVVKSVVKPTKVGSINKSARLNMAIAYIKSNGVLTVTRYSKLTGLTHSSARAELMAFASDRHNPVIVIKNGHKTSFALAA